MGIRADWCSLHLLSKTPENRIVNSFVAERRSAADRAPVLQFVLLILGLAAFWTVYNLVFKTACTYGLTEVEFFRRANFFDVLGIMDFGNYKRFSPLGFGVWGYLDFNLLVPLLGKAKESDAVL